ncbi:MAG: mechanosensitive ion channel [Saprospirales bacterium]|nr:mechanosensitive ion channel [Saprospirales bacterium]MBK7335958.1 mechanosensitive ion channel [Saprospirales bacterium]
MQPLFLQSLEMSPIGDIFYDLLRQFLAVLPSLTGALLILLIGWLIAKSLSRLIKKLLSRSGVDALAERLNRIELVEKARIRIVPSVLLAKVIYYVLMLVIALAATDVLGIEAVSNLMADIIAYVPNLLTAFLLLFVGLLFADFAKGIVLSATKSIGIPSAGLIANFIFYFILISVAMSALGQAGIDTEFLRANLTILIAGGVLAFALGYGLASREMMANFIASFYSKDKVKLGDTIRIGEVQGEVVAMDNSSLTLEGEDKKLIILPLSKLTSENVVIISFAPALEEEPQEEEAH